MRHWGKRGVRALQGQSVALFAKLRGCSSEEEFLVLQEEYIEAQMHLGHPYTPQKSIGEFQVYLERISKMSSYSTPGPTLNEQEAQRLRDQRGNLESITWYLRKLSERVEDLGVKDAAQFRTAARNAENAISYILGGLREEAK